MSNKEIPQLEIQVFLLEKELKELRQEFKTFKKIVLSMHDISSRQYLVLKNHAEKETSDDQLTRRT